MPGYASGVGVDGNLQIAAVATGDGGGVGPSSVGEGGSGSTGLQLIDVSNGMTPKLLHSVAVPATQVVVSDGLAYAAAGDTLSVVDLESGDVLQSLTLPMFTVTGLARDGTFLYAYGDDTLAIIDVTTEGAATVRGSLNVDIASSDVGVFAANGIVWLAGSGLRTVDVSNPDAPTLIHDADLTFTARRVALNGSGLGVLAPAGNGYIEVYDTSNPNATDNRLLQIPLSAGASDIAISRGIAYVGEDGQLEVVNYLPFDNKGVPPTVSISTSAPDVDLLRPGQQVLEGSTLPIQVTASDDVQVAKVELLVNGQLVQTDVSYPFDFFAVAPTMAQSGSTFTIQVKAFDTGGNVGLSNVLTLGLENDTSPPTIANFSPANGSFPVEGPQTVRVTFSKSMDPTTITPANFQLRDGNNNVVVASNIQVRTDDRVVQLSFPFEPAGSYQLVIDGSAVTDTAGNALSAGNITDSFTLTPRETLTLDNANAAPSAPGFSLYEGVTVTGSVSVNSSVAVQSVVLMLNGQIIGTTSTGPLSFSFLAPLLSAGASSFTLQAEVTDTSGLVTMTAPFVVSLLRDTTPPTIVGTNPADGATLNQGLGTVTITFSKPIAESSVTTSNFQIFEAGPSGVLGNPDEISIPITGLEFLANDTQIQLTVAPLQAGLYQLVIAEAGITDRPGNALGTGSFTSAFSLVPQLIQNGGFETGDLTGWTFIPASSGSDFVVGQIIVPHTGNYAADFGAVSFIPDKLSQTRATVPGQSYIVSYWLAHDATNAENDFQVSWGGTVIQDLNNVSAFDWTNYTFTETATSSSTILQFAGYEVPAWFAVDDVSVLGSNQPQFFAGTPQAPTIDTPILTEGQLQPVVSRAIANLAGAGYNVSSLSQVQVHLANLPNDLLGWTSQNTIWIDQTAQGYGWYTDVSTSSAAAFTQIAGPNETQALPGSPAYGHVDLLTVVTHELGHVLGFASVAAGILGHDWMTATLGMGVRRSPDAVATPAAPGVTPPTGGAARVGVAPLADAQVTPPATDSVTQTSAGNNGLPGVSIILSSAGGPGFVTTTADVPATQQPFSSGIATVPSVRGPLVESADLLSDVGLVSDRTDDSAAVDAVFSDSTGWRALDF